jgi:hypothetical protein
LKNYKKGLGKLKSVRIFTYNKEIKNIVMEELMYKRAEVLMGDLMRYKEHLATDDIEQDLIDIWNHKIAIVEGKLEEIFELLNEGIIQGITKKF